MNKKEHWETIYTTKQPNEVSWTQEIPQTSLDLILGTGVTKTAKIIDIGGGDSTLIDHLLDAGFLNITVLDISEAALNRAQLRLGQRAEQVKWIVSDITDFTPAEVYDVWHDRAVFHFLTSEVDIETYTKTAAHFAENMIIATFSVNGPLKCSGLEITQYDKPKMEATFGAYFQLQETILQDHTTPFGTLQNFIFSSWKNKNI